MTDTVFAAAVARVLSNEGGFQKNPKDRGNWTGGQIGVGELRGTKYGISARAHPDVDIENLTVAEAEAIIYTDYWSKFHLSFLPASIAGKALDMAVLCGGVPAIECLQRALRVCKQPIAVDGAIGAQTSTACLHVAPGALHEAFVAQLEAHFRFVVAMNPEDQEFLDGWLARAKQ